MPISLTIDAQQCPNAHMFEPSFWYSLAFTLFLVATMHENNEIYSFAKQ